MSTEGLRFRNEVTAESSKEVVMTRPAVSKELEEIIEVYLTSFLCWDILLFFCTNESVKISPAELSLALGRKEKDIYKVLDELARKGVLLRYFKQGTPYFELCADEEVNRRLGKLMEALADQSLRLMVVDQILKRELEENRSVKMTSLER